MFGLTPKTKMLLINLSLVDRLHVSTHFTIIETTIENSFLTITLMAPTHPPSNLFHSRVSCHGTMELVCPSHGIKRGCCLERWVVIGLECRSRNIFYVQAKLNLVFNVIGTKERVKTVIRDGNIVNFKQSWVTSRGWMMKRVLGSSTTWFEEFLTRVSFLLSFPKEIKIPICKCPWIINSVILPLDFMWFSRNIVNFDNQRSYITRTNVDWNTLVIGSMMNWRSHVSNLALYVVWNVRPKDVEKCLLIIKVHFSNLLSMCSQTDAAVVCPTLFVAWHE